MLLFSAKGQNTKKVAALQQQLTSIGTSYIEMVEGGGTWDLKADSAGKTFDIAPTINLADVTYVKMDLAVRVSPSIVWTTPPENFFNSFLAEISSDYVMATSARVISSWYAAGNDDLNVGTLYLTAYFSKEMIDADVIVLNLSVPSQKGSQAYSAAVSAGSSVAIQAIFTHYTNPIIEL